MTAYNIVFKIQKISQDENGNFLERQDLTPLLEKGYLHIDGDDKANDEKINSLAVIIRIAAKKAIRGEPYETWEK